VFAQLGDQFVLVRRRLEQLDPQEHARLRQLPLCQARQLLGAAAQALLGAGLSWTQRVDRSTETCPPWRLPLRHTASSCTRQDKSPLFSTAPNPVRSNTILLREASLAAQCRAQAGASTPAASASCIASLSCNTVHPNHTHLCGGLVQCGGAAPVLLLRLPHMRLQPCLAPLVEQLRQDHLRDTDMSLSLYGRFITL